MSDTDLAGALDLIIKTKVAEALAGGEGKSMVDMMVETALNGTVEVGHGYKTKKVPFIEYHTTMAIENAVAAALRDAVKDQNDMITAKVKAAAGPIVEKLAVKVVSALTDPEDFRASMTLNFNRD